MPFFRFTNRPVVMLRTSLLCLATTLAAATAVVSGLATDARAQNKSASWLTTNFQARTHYSTPASDSMKYRLYVPVNYNPAQKYPIVVALHGIGERGYNNVNQLTLEELVQPWVRDSVQAKHPHFVMVPQCPPNPSLWWPSNTWDGTRSKPNIMIVEVLDSLKREYSLDTTRFYVAGLSMGGFGTIELMKWNPTMFAAAVPTAGGGDTAAAAVAELIKTPMWAFHSATDPTVNVDRGSRAIATKMEIALGKPLVRFVSDPDMANPTAITVDSLRKAVYVDGADFLYSEVRNAPGSGNALHQAGWFAAWRHPMLTDWVFSKRKVDGVSVSVAPTVSATRAFAPRDVKVVFRNGGILLEKKVPGQGTVFYTLEGARLNGSHAP